MRMMVMDGREEQSEKVGVGGHRLLRLRKTCRHIRLTETWFGSLPHVACVFYFFFMQSLDYFIIL